MKARVTIFLKEEVLDPQGNTIGDALKSLHFQDIQQVRVGKIIEIEHKENISHEQFINKIHSMCEKLLVNPVTEQYHIFEAAENETH